MCNGQKSGSFPLVLSIPVGPLQSELVFLGMFQAHIKTFVRSPFDWLKQFGSRFGRFPLRYTHMGVSFLEVPQKWATVSFWVPKKHGMCQLQKYMHGMTIGWKTSTKMIFPPVNEKKQWPKLVAEMEYRSMAPCPPTRLSRACRALIARSQDWTMGRASGSPRARRCLRVLWSPHIRRGTRPQHRTTP